MIIKERLDEALNQIRAQIAQDIRRKVAAVDFMDSTSSALFNTYFLLTPFHLTDRYINKVILRTNFDVGARMSNFLATGNLISPTGLDLQQASGFTIVAEKLNWYRYISHFRCIHRGAFFAELKTTTVRKLLPEAWGKTSFAYVRVVSYTSAQASCAPYIRPMALRVVYLTISLDLAELSPVSSKLEPSLPSFPRLV